MATPAELQSQKLILITCTYQKPHRLSYIKKCIATFKNVPDILWIVVEDGHDIDKKVESLLNESGIPYVYLNLFTRSHGNAQKNLALTYIRDNRLEGIVYVADDDNKYDLRLFEEIRKTQRISVFPVGNLGPNGIERPIVKDGRIVAWDVDWPSRKFPIDQGGYALNAQLLYELKDPIWSHSDYGGESEFIGKLIKSPDELEILCDECRKCYIWHNHLLLLWPFGHVFIKVKVVMKKILKKMGVRFNERL